MTLANTKTNDEPGQADSVFEYGSQWVRADFHVNTKLPLRET